MITLTPEQIHAMQDGRETDAAVAERVMGARWHFVWPPPNSVRFLSFDSMNGLAAGNEPIAMHLHDLPRYSSDIAAAFEIVEILRQKYCVRLRTVHDESGHKWVCQLDPLYSTRNEVVGGYAYADTLSLAICRAALLVLAKRQDAARGE